VWKVQILQVSTILRAIWEIVVAHYHYRTGDFDLALKEGEEVLTTLEKISFLNTQPIVFYTWNLAKHFLDLWEYNLENRKSYKTARKCCKRCQKLLYRSRKLFPFCDAGTLVLKGRENWLEGRHELAIKQWRTAISKNENDIFGVLGQFELGKHLPVGPERTLRLQRSVDRFEGAQLQYYARMARKELNLSKEEVASTFKKSNRNFWLWPLAVGTIVVITVVFMKWWKSK